MWSCVRYDTAARISPDGGQNPSKRTTGAKYSRCAESRREVGCLPTFSPIELWLYDYGIDGRAPEQ